MAMSNKQKQRLSKTGNSPKELRKWGKRKKKIAEAFKKSDERRKAIIEGCLRVTPHTSLSQGVGKHKDKGKDYLCFQVVNGGLPSLGKR